MYSSNHMEFGLKKQKSRSKDQTSWVPDEILVSILSKLSCVKEAARTSVISQRWEKLWMQYEGNLEFDVSNKLRIVHESNWPPIIFDHLKSMNQVLRLMLLHKHRIDSVVLRCPYLKTTPQTHEFHTFFQFLTSRPSIQILDVDLNALLVGAHMTDFLSLPLEFYAWIKQPHAISSLTSLSLSNVSVTNETVEYFVANCPSLERLCVLRSDLLTDLRIVGDASLKLKYLRIRGFYGMKSLVVSAPNLVSLDCFGGVLYGIKLHVSNVPKLVDVCIGEDVISYTSGSLSTYLAQLRFLKLSFTTFRLSTPTNVVFSNLKHLVFRAVIFGQSHSILRFTSSLVEASPLLEKFTFDPVDSFLDDEVGLHKMTTPPAQQYSQNQRLKVVEFNGFKGAAPEVELLLYFAQNFTSLHQIVIDTTTTSRLFTMEAPNDVLQLRKERAVQLVKHIPRGVHFLLI